MRYPKPLEGIRGAKVWFFLSIGISINIIIILIIIIITITITLFIILLLQAARTLAREDATMTWAKTLRKQLKSDSEQNAAALRGGAYRASLAIDL